LREKRLKLIAVDQFEKLVSGDLSSIHPELVDYLREVGAIRDNQFFRVRAAIALVRIGVSVERTAKLLDWKGFESLCEEILNCHGYVTTKHLRFSFEGKRYEIDILAKSNGLILSIDCKRWSRVRRSSLFEAALLQMERTEALSRAIPRLNKFVLAQGKTSLVPMVICWVPGGAGIYRGIPIVPLHSFNSYLTEFDPMDANISRIELPWRVEFRTSFLS